MNLKSLAKQALNLAVSLLHYSGFTIAIPRKHHAKWLFPQEKPPCTTPEMARKLWKRSSGMLGEL
jgi:hypothetical protein